MKYYLFLQRSFATKRLAKNLERGRHALDLCDNILQTVQQQQRKVATLHSLAELSLQSGDRDLTLQLLREKGRCQLELNQMRGFLQTALEGLKTVMAFLERESTLLGITRLWDDSTPKENIHTYTPWRVGEIGELQIAFRRRVSDKAPRVLRKPKVRTKPLSPEEVEEQRTKQYAQNLEYGLIAATQTENLMQMLRDQAQKVDTLTQKAQLAQNRGNRELAHALLRERESYEEALSMTRTNFQQALETLDAIMAALETFDANRATSRKEEALTVSVLVVPSNDSVKILRLY